MYDEEEKRIRKLASQRKIRMCSNEQVKYMADTIEEILIVIADVTGINRIRNASVSDESSINDFLSSFNDTEANEVVLLIGESLGVELDPSDPSGLYLVEVAKKILHG